jgi:hypothetical protein
MVRLHNPDHEGHTQLCVLGLRAFNLWAGAVFVFDDDLWAITGQPDLSGQLGEERVLFTARNVTEEVFEGVPATRRSFNLDYCHDVYVVGSVANPDEDDDLDHGQAS